MTEGTFTGGVGPRSDRVGPDLEALRERFFSVKSPGERIKCYGLLAWDSDPELNCGAEIHISEHPQLGFAIMWVLHVPKGMRADEFYTVGTRAQLTEEYWVDANAQEWVLEGNFVPLETAWAVIEDFFADPLTLSKRATWIDTEDMPEFPV